MKKIIRVILTILCIFILVTPTKAKAAESDYSINNYKIDAVVHQNATVSVTEHLTVNYNSPQHGIFRDIPEYITKTMVDDNGNIKKMDYANPITKIKVEGAPYKVQHKGDNLSIVIGDKNTTVTGEKEYTISYLLDMGDDRISSYDEFNYNIIGTEWDTVINSASFTIKFDKDVDFTGLKVYSGEYGSTKQGDVTFTAQNNTITGHINKPLSSFTGVTVYQKLPEGYYVGARTKSNIPYIIMAVIALISSIVLVVSLIIKKGDRKNKVVETVEFYPPEGINSAQVGYIIDGSADDKDLVSLIIWFANKGYLSIEEKNKKTYINKIKDLPSDSSDYLKTMFDGLFKNAEKVDLSSLESKFITTLNSAKNELSSYYRNEEKLFDNKFTSVKNIFVLVYTASIILAGYFAAPILTNWVFFVKPLALIGVPFIFFTALINIWARGSRFNGKFKLILLIILTVIVVVISGLFAASNSIYSSYYPLVVLTEVAAIISYGLHANETEYKIKMTGKLLGLKTFIKKAELDQINKLVEENPEYYYSVLPYAYVFGLTDKWIKKFEGITINPPEWYNSDDVIRGFSSYYFVSSLTRDMNSGLNNARKEYQAEQAAAAKSSTDGFSGGGFSGGGSGGGGGGSW